MRRFSRGATLLSAILMVGCAPIPDPVDSGDNSDRFVDDTASPLYGAEADGKSVTKTYYVSNPTSGGCASALRLTAKGKGITKIAPSGCEISCTACGIAPSWDTLTSAGASTLYDTWYNRSDKFDKDYASATGQAWCDSYNPVTVKVTGTSVTSLSYWFTDDSDCWF